MSDETSLPTDLAVAHVLILSLHETAAVAQARDAEMESEAKHRELRIEKLKYMIAKLRHERFGQSSGRSAVLEQLDLQTIGAAGGHIGSQSCYRGGS